MLTIKDILLILKAKTRWIILSLVSFLIAAGVYTYVFIKPVYSSTASLYVQNAVRASEDITTGELTASQRLVKTYIVVLRSSTTMQQVSDKLDTYGYDLTPGQIRGMITTGAINDTEAFSITASSENRELARLIVTSILEVLPDEIIRVVDAGGVRIIDQATDSAEAYYPFTKNLCIGAAAGAVFAIILVLLQAVFDTKVHGEESLSAVFDIPIIGRVPAFEEESIERVKNKDDEDKKRSMKTEDLS